MSPPYEDEFFSSSDELDQFWTANFGYAHTYNAAGAYASVYAFAKAVEATGRSDFTTTANYEELHSSLKNLNLTNSLFGPITFNSHNQNEGRR